MEITDPFFSVKKEVERTIDSVNTLFSLWTQLHHNPDSEDEFHRITDELKNNLRSIEWDLDDLEDTIKIAEKNPKKFNLDLIELDERRKFVASTKFIIDDIKDKIEHPRVTNQTTDLKIHRPHSKEMNKLVPGFGQKFNYTKLDTDELDNEEAINGTIQRQQMIMKEQDNQLFNIGSSVSTLKSMSTQIGSELDEQSVMLDDFAQKMDTTSSKLDNVMKKMSKVLHMSNDRRQWVAIGVLLLILLIVIILLAVL